MLFHLKQTIHQAEQLKMNFAKCHNFKHLDGPQGHVILYLKHHQNQPIFQKDIEDFLSISKSVASNLIFRMKRNGFIETYPYEKDKRHKVIQLTPFGYEKAEKIDDFVAMFKSILFKDISQAEIEKVEKVIFQIDRNIENARIRLDEKENAHDKDF